MKILKISLILLVPAIGLVSCQKSELKPASPGTTVAPVTHQDNQDLNARHSDPSTEATLEGDNAGTDIVGSGDDDRDGGDKRKKVIR